jgi:ADP-ribose pyrophosphatase
MLSVKPYFFYGTLRDEAVLEAVIGRAAPMVPARIVAHRAAPVTGAVYPVLVPDPGAVTNGVLVAGLDAAEARRLVEYEGPGYRLALLPVEDADGKTVQARLFLPVGQIAHESSVWSFAEWQQRDRARWLSRLGGRRP